MATTAVRMVFQSRLEVRSKRRAASIVNAGHFIGFLSFLLLLGILAPYMDRSEPSVERVQDHAQTAADRAGPDCALPRAWGRSTRGRRRPQAPGQSLQA